MGDDSDSRSLLQSMLAIFTRRPSQTSANPGSLRSRQREAWLRADSFLHQDDLDGADPESVTRTLRALEEYVQDDCDREIDLSSTQPQSEPYPTLRRMVDNPTPDPHATPRTSIHRRKRGRQCDDAIAELLNLEQESKKRRVLPREEPSSELGSEEPDAEFAVLLRRHLLTLDSALRRHWVCVCHNCSGLTVRLSLPQHKKRLEAEASFEVFFGVRSVPATALQEGKITVKDLDNSTSRRSSAPILSHPPEFAHICQSITDSLGQRNCLHFTLEDGVFQKLRPRPKTFSSDRISRTVTLSALFNRQKELLRGESVLPLKGKRILAVTLASALLPYLETPWLPFSFDHSKIHFFEPMKNGELPDITKPFLLLEHIPIIPARGSKLAKDSDTLKHAVHPNSTVLALGILLCELHYCLPVELMAEAKDSSAKGVNDDFYTCLDKLGNLEDDAGVDYYLATKACLIGDYYPTGESADFEDASVQRRFYQNVVKRLEAVIFKAWGIQLDDLKSFSSLQNQSCWGSIGQELVRLHTRQPTPFDSERSTMAFPHRSVSGPLPIGYSSLHSEALLSTKPSLGTQNQECSVKLSKPTLTFFDASQQTCSVKERRLSEQWMDSLLSSISRFVDLNPDLTEPVRIAILDSGLDPESPFLPNPRIKEARSFIHDTEPHDIRDEIGHGTHALGLLLKVAPCAEIYVARVARQESLDPNTYDDIAKAINYSVEQWDADIISMSFGIREQHEGMMSAISNALNKRTLLFAAASNDGANLSRSFPAQWPGVFCIHSTDGNGNPSSFNPTASETDVNFSLLGENVSSHWPAGINGHEQSVNIMSGTSVATPIAAGLAASVLSFVRQQDENVAVESERVGPWLKIDSSMDAVLKSMVRQRRGAGYDYITPHVLFDSSSTKEFVYARIEHLKKNIYRN